MKNKLSTWLTAIVFGLGIFTFSGSAVAGRCCHSSCSHHQYYCKTLPGYWMWGYQYPAQEVCYEKIRGTWLQSPYKFVPCDHLRDGCGCSRGCC